MIGQLLLATALAVVLYFVLFPRKLPALLRKLGRSVGDAGRAGTELVTGEEVANSPLARYEVRAGEIVALRILGDHPMSSNARLQERVAAVGGRLSGHVERQGIPYRFAAVHGSEPNAFAVAGGSIFVTERLVDLCGPADDALAGVLGHEIVHIDQRHALRNLATSAAVQGGVRLLSLGRGAILSRVVGGMERLVVQGYRQEQELEADRFGARLARLAGYNPEEMVRLFERLEREHPESGGALEEILGYFQSHPPLRRRVEHLRRELEQRSS